MRGVNLATENGFNELIDMFGLTQIHKQAAMYKASYEASGHHKAPNKASSEFCILHSSPASSAEAKTLEKTIVNTFVDGSVRSSLTVHVVSEYLSETSQVLGGLRPASASSMPSSLECGWRSHAWPPPGHLWWAPFVNWWFLR